MEQFSDKTHSFIVCQHDTVKFLGIELHRVCASYILAREAEYACRLCLLPYLEPGFEAVGTYLDLNHIGPAKIGQNVLIKSNILKFENREMLCSFEASIEGKIIAHGSTKQKILSLERLHNLFKQ